ncbi:MAG: DsbA family protein [Alphaproteobacteria bacterium]
MLTRRRFATVLGAATVGLSRAGAARAGTYGEHALGPEDAPVTVIEFASMTCPHCAAFHNETFGKLRETYIDPGKIRFVFRDFPLDGVAVRAAALAHCAGPERYFGFLDVLFQTQSTWARDPDPMAALTKIGRLGGLDAATIQGCLNDGDLIDSILGSRQRGEQEFDVSSTPTLVINGEVYDGDRTFEAMSKAIDALLPPS